jgi:hypothetical protein
MVYVSMNQSVTVPLTHQTLFLFLSCPQNIQNKPEDPLKNTGLNIALSDLGKIMMVKGL